MQVASSQNGTVSGAAPDHALDTNMSSEEPADVEQQYITALAPMQVTDYDATLPTAYNRWVVLAVGASALHEWRPCRRTVHVYQRAALLSPDKSNAEFECRVHLHF